MTDTDTDIFKAPALKWVNEIRAQYSLEPLTELRRGYPHASTCPLARSLSERGIIATVGKTSALVYCARYAGELSGSFSHPLNEAARQFVHEFDHGLIPELET